MDKTILAILCLISIQIHAQTEFVTVWNTTNTIPGGSNYTSVKIPTNGSGYNYDVDWNNDGIYDDLNVTGSITHDYGIPGTYTIRIRGDFPRIYFNSGRERDKLLAIEQWGSIQWQSMNHAFAGCKNLQVLAADTPDLSQVTDMEAMFLSAYDFNQDIGDWNVSNVTNMKDMFAGTPFNQNIGGWNVSNVSNMANMFYKASSFNQDIGGWNVGNVTDMSGMFQGAGAFDQDLGNWKVINVTTMDRMFNDAGLSTPNYDSLLNSWSRLELLMNVPFDAGNSTYCYGQAARAELINARNWSITDNGQGCLATDYFITTWKTDNPGNSNSTSITVPTSPFALQGTYNYDVSWKNDGVWETGFTGDATHDYGTAGTYTVAIRGTFPKIQFSWDDDNQKLLSIEQWGTIPWSSMANAFRDCSNLQGNATDRPDLSNVTSMAGMFRECNQYGWDV